MFPGHPTLRKPVGAGCSDAVFAHHLQHLTTREGRHEDNREIVFQVTSADNVVTGDIPCDRLQFPI